jgi:metal-sulfur cluster biosynthetic enzyme
VEWRHEGAGVISEQQVRATLNAIIDPCSRSAGCAAGLDEMGLLRQVEVAPRNGLTDVRVVIGVTEYGCLMGAPFADEAWKLLQALDGVGVVNVELDREFNWDLDDMRGDYRERLAAHRRRRLLLEIPVAAPGPRVVVSGGSSAS